MTCVNIVFLQREGFVIEGSVESRFYMNCLFIPVAETKNGEMVENFLFWLFKHLETFLCRVFQFWTLLYNLYDASARKTKSTYERF